MFPWVRASAALSAAAVCGGLIALASGTAAAQETIVIDRGSLELWDAGPIGGGDLHIGGTRGFTFTSKVRNEDGEVGSAVCELGCVPGMVIDLKARWSGTGLTGVATLDAHVHPVLGDTSSMSVDFNASLTIPAAPDETEPVLVPFTIAGLFIVNGENVAIAGAGTAAVHLGHANVGWEVTRITYTFGPILPEPWFTNGTSEVPLGGTAMFTTNMFVVSGTGDFWGTLDSGHLVWTSTTGDTQIVARVRDQSSTHPLAKAGVMIRQSLFQSDAFVILDLKPDGGLEFMTRPGTGELTTYLAGGFAPVPEPWLKLTRDGDVFTGSISGDGLTWAVVGTVTVPMRSDAVAALAVSSHEFYVRNTVVYDDVSVISSGLTPINLLTNGDFEAYDPPALGPPGWISDHLFRQVPAKSEYHQPRSGAKNGACWTTEYLDCGIYQQVTAPASGTYTLRMHASADRTGGLVGVNVDGRLAASMNVEAAPFGVYSEYVMTFTASAGDVIHVWMYSPAWPGYVVIDDASLSAPAAGTTHLE